LLADSLQQRKAREATCAGTIKCVVGIAVDVHILAYSGAVLEGSACAADAESLRPGGAVGIVVGVAFVLDACSVFQNVALVAAQTGAGCGIVPITQRINSCAETFQPEIEVFRAEYAFPVLERSAVGVNRGRVSSIEARTINKVVSQIAGSAFSSQIAVLFAILADRTAFSTI